MNIAQRLQFAFDNGKRPFNTVLHEAKVIGHVYECSARSHTIHVEFVDGSIAVFCTLDQTITAYGSK